MLTPKDLEKYHKAAERILNAMDNSPVPISWHEMDRMALQSVIAKELILIDKEARKLMYAKCQICAKTWNISISQRIPKQGYICPWCENSIRQSMRNTIAPKRKQK